MSPEQIVESLLYFDLPKTATLADLDKKYDERISKHLKNKTTNSTRANAEHAAMEVLYGKLVDQYITQQCAEGRDDRNMRLNFDNIKFHRYEPGVVAVFQARTADRPIAGQESHDTTSSDSEEPSASSSGRRPQPADDQRALRIIEYEGDIFDAPNNVVIVHAVNCLGVWGSGFAAELRSRFPAAYSVYVRFCRAAIPRSTLAGHSLIIPPQPADYAGKGKLQPRRWIACLFTSVGYGQRNGFTDNPGRSSRATVERYTDTALADLRSGLNRAQEAEGLSNPIGELYSPKFNSGSFGVPWRRTLSSIMTSFAEVPATWNVVSRPAESTDEAS